MNLLKFLYRIRKKRSRRRAHPADSLRTLPRPLRCNISRRIERNGRQLIFDSILGDIPYIERQAMSEAHSTLSRGTLYAHFRRCGRRTSLNLWLCFGQRRLINWLIITCCPYLKRLIRYRHLAHKSVAELKQTTLTRGVLGELINIEGRFHEYLPFFH